MPEVLRRAGRRPGRSAAHPLARLLVRLVVGPVAVALALAGCSSLPVDGPVTSGAVADPQERRDLQVGAIGPVDGASAPAVLRGFLGASVGVQDDFAAARSFLVASAQRRWQPSARVVVHPRDSREVVSVQAGRELADGEEPDPAAGPVTYTVTVAVTALVDDHGVYSPAAADTQEVVEIRVVQQDGEWRIDQVPDELLVDESDFTLNWRATPLYFSDSLGRGLVPEVRWFADRPSTATTAAVELLRGPSSWLAPATRAGDLTGVGLTSRSVPVEDGVARVDLTPAALDLDTGSRARLQRELEATVADVPGVTSVEVTVAGGELGAAADLRTAPVTGGAPVLVQGGALVRWDGASVAPVTGLGALPTALTGAALSDPAVRGRSYAALAGRGALVRWDGAGAVAGLEAPAEPVLTGDSLLAPAFDDLGWLWSGETRSGGSVAAVSPDGELVEVSAPSLAGRVVVALRPSPEGARAAVASTASDGSDPRVEVVGVERSSVGAPLALSAPSDDAADAAPGTPALAGVEDVTWVDDRTVAVLGSLAGAADEPAVLLVTGGRAEGLGPVTAEGDAPLVAVAAGAGERTLLVVGADGRVLQRSGAGWSVLDALAGASGLSYPASDPVPVGTSVPEGT